MSNDLHLTLSAHTASSPNRLTMPAATSDCYDSSYSSEGSKNIQRLKEEIAILTTAANTLLREREKLSYELSHEMGLIDEERLDELIDHLIPSLLKRKQDEVDREAVILTDLLDVSHLTADVVAVVLGCVPSQAILALDRAAERKK